MSPSPPKIVNQQPNIPIINNPQTIDDEDFSPPLDSSSHIEYKPPVFSSSPTHYNYSYESEKPSSPVVYHDYKPNYNFYSIPPPPTSGDNSPAIKSKEEYIPSTKLNSQKEKEISIEREKEKAKKEDEERMERKRLEYQRLQQKRQVIQQQQQIQLLKLKQQYQQNQQLKEQEPNYQRQLQMEREKYDLIQQKIRNMNVKKEQPPQQQPQHVQQNQYQQSNQQQQRQPLLANPESPKRNIKTAFESIHISSSPSSSSPHKSLQQQHETSPIISPHKPKIDLPVFDIDLDFHTNVDNNNNNNNYIKEDKNPNNEIMSPLFKEENKAEEEEEEEDLPLWAKVAASKKKKTENLINQQNINETDAKPKRKQWNDEISKDIQKRREKYPPKQPEAPTLFALKPTSLLIKWNENKNDKKKKFYKIDSYMLQYQTYPDGIWKNVGNGIIRNLNYTFDNLKSGYSYRFRIKAHNSEGWSIYSNCSEIYAVPGEKKKEDNSKNDSKNDIKIGVRREFSSIRKSTIDEDLKRKEIAERRNIYLYNGKYPKYSDKMKTNKRRSVSEIVFYINCNLFINRKVE